MTQNLPGLSPESESLLISNHNLFVTISGPLSAWTPPNQDPLIHAAILFLGKALKTHIGLSILVSKGFVQDAHSLARDLVELDIRAAWLVKGGAVAAARLIGKAKIERLRTIEQKMKSGSKVWPLAEVQEAIARFPQAKIDADNVKNLHLKRHDYLEGTLKQAAEKVGLEDLYNFVYRRLSDFVHTGVGVFDDFLTPESGGTIQLTIDPSGKGAFYPLEVSRQSVLRIAESVYSTLDLDLAKPLQAYRASAFPPLIEWPPKFA